MNKAYRLSIPASVILFILLIWVTLLAYDMNEIRVQQVGPTTQIVIRTGADNVSYSDFYLKDPPRIVVDLSSAIHRLKGFDFSDINRGGVRSIRTSQYKDSVVRMVIDLVADKVYSVFPNDSEILVVFENTSGSFETWSTTGVRDVYSQPTMVTKNKNKILNQPPKVDSEELFANNTTFSQEPEKVMPQPPSTSEREIFPQEENRISVDFQNSDIEAVLRVFSEFSGQSVVAGKDVAGKVTAKISDLPWDQALSVILKANGFGLRRDGEVLLVDTLVNIRDEEMAQLAADTLKTKYQKLETTILKLNFVNSGDLIPVVQSLLSERGSVQADAKTNALIVTDRPDMIAEVERTLTELDVETRQVTIKAKLVFADKLRLEEFGVNWVVSNLANPLSDTQVDVATGGADQILDPFLNLSVGTLKSGVTVNALVRALEREDILKTVAEPQITTLNNLEADVLVGDETPIRVLDVGADADRARASVQIKETGVRLTVTPQITANGKILLKVHAENSDVSAAAGDIGVSFTTQEANSTLLLNDSETGVIAGLTVTDISRVRAGVPIISRVPLLGYLFSFKRNLERVQDLIIFITPYVVPEKQI